MVTRTSPREEQIDFLRGCGATCSPREAAKVLGGNPYYFNCAAKNGTLDLEYTWHGRNLRIYTESIVKKITGGNNHDEAFF